MASDNFRETLQPYCITVEGFPPNTDETSVRQIFTNCLKLENIPGVQPNETKWLMILRDRGEVESFLERSEIHLQNNSLKITPCVPCDIPTSWEKFDQQSLGTPGFPIGQPQNFDPYGGYPGPPGHHGYHGLPPTYPNIQYPGNGQYPGQQGTTHLIYAGYPPNYGGPQGPTSMGVRPAGSEGKDHKIYPVASTPPGPQVGQQYHGQVQSQESKLPGVSGEDDHKPLPTDSPRSDLSQDPVKDIDQVSSLKGKESHPSDGRTGQDVKSEEQRKQDAPYLSMPYSYGQPYHGPGQEPMYSMPMYPGQYVPRFQGPFPSHPPPPYHVHPRMHSGPNNSPRMIHPHVPNQSSPYHVPDGGVDSSDTYDNETCGPTTVIREEETDDEREEPLGMIKVTDLPPNITEDSLTLFFENKKKSGGGEIEDVDFQKESAMAILTFKDPEVVDRILQKVPFLLEKKQIKVERFVPESYNSGSIDESPKEETKPSYTIEVRGMKKDTSADTVELYFESKKPAGKFVDVVKFDDSEIDDGVIYVTYETEEVMKAVLERTHKLDDAILEIKEHIPPPPPKPRPMYENKVLIKGKNPNTTSDGLENFLEAKAGVTPTNYLPGEEEDTVLVTFEKPPDFEKLELACKKRALDKHFLKVYRVPISNCIIVKGTSEKTSLSTLEFYFENTRRSGGGDVTEVKDQEDGSYLVYFEDHSVIDSVCARSHTVDGQTLHVKLFHELIGDSGEDGPKFKVPGTLVITDIDPRKIQFVKFSQPNKEGLEKQLETHHTKILWPEKLTDPVKLECLLTKDIKDCRTLAKNWKQTAQSSLDKFLDVLIVFKHDILQEAWANVMEQLQNMSISHPDGVMVAVEKVSFEIFVMGHKKFATDVSENVNKIIKEIADELERKKKQVKETTAPLKHHQVMMLSITHYKETMEKKYQGMKILIDFKGRTITYEGLYSEVTSAKVDMYEILNSMVSSQVSGYNKGKYAYLQEKTVKQYVAGKMKKEKITAVWEMNDNSFVVFAQADEDAVRAAHILKGSVLETIIDVKKESTPLLSSDRWANEEQDIKSSCSVLVQMKVEIDKPCIVVYSTDQDAETVRERVVDFLSMNTVYKSKLTVNTGMLRFLQVHCLKEIKAIADQYKIDQVSIDVNNLGIEIKGTEIGLNKAKMAIGGVIDGVEKKEHVLKKPGITKLMTSDDSMPKISQVEKSHGVVIVPSDESEDDVDGGRTRLTPDPRRRDGFQEMASCSQRGFHLKVMMGDITNLKVDVLVNAANRELLHNGGLAKAIVDKGGKNIQQDCSKYIKVHKHLMEGDVYFGIAGSLSCNYIAHAVGPKWQGGHFREKELLQEAVFKCLEETDNRQQTSIALPALGAGVFGYPADKSTKAIVKTIEEFYIDNPRSYIQEIYLCDVNQSNVDHFIKALQKQYGAGNVKVSSSNGGAREKWSSPQSKPRKGWKKAQPDVPSHSPSVQNAINISIHLVKGQIAHQKVDVIVNTCSKDLKLSNGAVSSSLLTAAGPQMQNECDQNYQGISFGEVAITKGYNLSCQHVCHGSLPGWDGGAISLVTLQKFMMSCLEEATNRGCESIAFPAMGTGNLNYPRDIVAREMYKIVTKYSNQNPSSPVRKVLFVIYDKDVPTVKAFETAEQSQGKSPAKGGNRYSRQYRTPSQEDYGQHHHQGASAKSSQDGSRYEEVNLELGNVTLKIYQGDITQAKVDAIVNGTNAEFDFTRGKVSNAILKMGGAGLMKQVKHSEREMKSTGIAVTITDQGTPMPCDMIIHINAEETKTSWKSKFLMAMDKANQKSAKSVAFPALGTALSSSPEETASSFVDALIEFIGQGPDSVTQVHMVVFEQPMYQKFISTMQATFQQHQKKSNSWFHNLWGRKSTKFEWNPKINILHRDLSCFPIMVYGSNLRKIADAISDLESVIEKNFREKIFQEEIIKSFTKSQEQQINDFAQAHGIEVKVETRIGRIRLNGLLENISDASDELNKLIRDCEKRKMKEQEAALIGDMVQWHFMLVTGVGEKLEEYPPDINALLEKAFKGHKNQVKFADNARNMYVVDFRTLEEFPENDPVDRVKVIRKCKMADTTFEAPSDWSSVNDKDNLSVVVIPQSDPTFTKVQKQFLASVGSKTVIKIERIQNRTLYQQYIAKKRLVDTENAHISENEKMLWHGTAAETVDSINSHGFNRSYCGKNATAFGDGVYFAVNANYSASTTYARPDLNNHQRMYLCKVITGEFTQGKRGMRVPPLKKAPHILYDSVVDTPANPGMYIIFNDTQAYPEYLITFQ